MVENVRDLLNRGISNLDELPQDLLKLLPNGKYINLLFDITPKLAAANQENNYFTFEELDNWPDNKQANSFL